MNLTNDRLKRLPVGEPSKLAKEICGKETINPGIRLRLWGNGLYIVCHKNVKIFGFTYRNRNKQQKQAIIGTFSPTGDGISTFTIEQALNAYNTEIAKLKNLGIDPREARKLAKYEKDLEDVRNSNTFAKYYPKWITGKNYGSKQYENKVKRNFEKYCGSIMNMPLHKIEETDIRSLLDNLAGIGSDKKDTTHRLYLSLHDLFIKAKRDKLITQNPMSEILPAEYPAPKLGKFNHVVSLSILKKVLNALDEAKGEAVTVLCLQLMPHLFLRASELLSIRWENVDFQNRLIKLHKAKVKGRSINDEAILNQPFDFCVPLSDYAVTILSKLKLISGNTPYVFSNRYNNGPLDHSTLLKALRSCLKSHELETSTCIHGFRYTARSLAMAKLSIQPRVLEQQMSHSGDEKGERAIHSDKYGYDSYLYMPERRALMDVYSLFLLGVKDIYEEITPEEARQLQIEGKHTAWQKYVEKLQAKYVELSRSYEQVDG